MSKLKWRKFNMINKPKIVSVVDFKIKIQFKGKKHCL